MKYRREGNPDASKFVQLLIFDIFAFSAATLERRKNEFRMVMNFITASYSKIQI